MGDVKTRHLPRSSGIYQIVNLTNGKIYVGSSRDVMNRGIQHRRELRLQRHSNPKLQRAWSKYGEGAFEMRLLEVVEESQQLVEREQYWLDITQCVKTGYNCLPNARSRIGYKYDAVTLREMKERRCKAFSGFITPEGAEITVIRPYLFREQTGMHSSVFSGLRHGRVCSWKGWTHVNAKPKSYNPSKLWSGFISPEGEEVPPFQNLADFCAGRSLDPSSMNKVYTLKQSNHKEWRHKGYVKKPRLPRRDKLYTGFIDPDGSQRDIFNLTGFCRENGLDHATMYKVLQGKARQHKGWTYNPALETRQ